MLKLTGVTLHGKVDTLKFNPCELISRFAAYTGRKSRTPEQIEKMVQSLLLNGQEQDFTYRKGFDGGPIPITGHTRILAGAQITERHLKGSNGVQYGPENPFLLRGAFRQMNEVEALFHTFAENDDDTRTPLNDVDIAFFIRTVSESTGLTDSGIAEKLGKPASWVSTHRVVLDLDAASQALVASGVVKFGTVSTLAKIEPAKRAAAVAKASTDNGGRVTAPALAKAAAELGAVTAKPLTHTDAEFKAWVRATIETTPASAAQSFLFAILDYRAGGITLDELTAKFAPLLGEEFSADVPKAKKTKVA